MRRTMPPNVVINDLRAPHPTNGVAASLDQRTVRKLPYHRDRMRRTFMQDIVSIRGEESLTENVRKQNHQGSS